MAVQNVTGLLRVAGTLRAKEWGRVEMMRGLTDFFKTKTAKDAQSPRKFECLYGQKLRMAHFSFAIWKFCLNFDKSQHVESELKQFTELEQVLFEGKHWENAYNHTRRFLDPPLAKRSHIQSHTRSRRSTNWSPFNLSNKKIQGRRCSFWNKPILAQLNFVTNWSNNAIPKANGSGWQ